MCIKVLSIPLPTVDLDARTSTSRADAAVEGNARLTAANAAVLSVVLPAERFSRIGPWLAVSGQ
jgi:hypothetical protein